MRQERGPAGLIQGGENTAVQVCQRIWATADTTIVADQAQLDLPPFQVAPWVLLVSIAVGLLVPLLSALGPLWAGTGIPVRQAMTAYGVSVGKRQNASAWGRRVYWMPQTVWLGVRGVFRRPGRATLTLLALTISGTMFLAVQVTNESIGVTLSHESRTTLACAQRYRGAATPCSVG